VARRATVINQEKAKSPNVLVLDAGNALYGQPIALQTQGKAIVDAMNKLGYQAMALGDSDFRYGTTVLQERMKEATFPFLSANVVISSTGKLLAKPYIIVTVGGRKIGLIGLTNPEAAQMAAQPYRPIAGKGTPTVAPAPSEAIIVRDPIEAAKQAVAEVQKETNVIIVISHLGQAIDQQVINAVPGITAVISGKDRQAIEPLKAAATDAVTAESGFDGELLGILTLEIGSNGQVTKFSGQSTPLNPDVADDPTLKALVDKYKAEVKY
jgi:2',3'-cyclic-nucleotide 2'-phosphodiesterase/3'-nucleotidase